MASCANRGMVAPDQGGGGLGGGAGNLARGGAGGTSGRGGTTGIGGATGTAGTTGTAGRGGTTGTAGTTGVAGTTGTAGATGTAGRGGTTGTAGTTGTGGSANMCPLGGTLDCTAAGALTVAPDGQVTDFSATDWNSATGKWCDAHGLDGSVFSYMGMGSTSTAAVDATAHNLKLNFSVTAG